MIKIVYPINKNIYVVGPIYNKFNLFEEFLEDKNENDIFIINGNICFPIENLEKRIDTLKELQKKYNIYYLMGEKDFQYLNKLKKEINFNDYFNWLSSQENCCQITFVNQTSISIINGEMPQNILKLNENNLCLELSFCKNLQWHEKYSGILGYVISNYPICKDGIITYDYSCSIGTSYEDEQLFIQKVDSTGLNKTFILKPSNK